MPPISNAKPAKLAFSAHTVFYRGTADMPRVSKSTLGRRTSVRSDLIRYTNNTVHAEMLNYRRLSRYSYVRAFERCLTHAHCYDICIKLVDTAPHAITTTFTYIIDTSYIRQPDARFVDVIDSGVTACAGSAHGQGPSASRAHVQTEVAVGVTSQ